MTGFERADALLFMGGLAFVIGWSFALGVAMACKFQKWAPVNIVHQLNDFRDSTAEYKLNVLREKAKEEAES